MDVYFSMKSREKRWKEADAGILSLYQTRVSTVVPVFYIVSLLVLMTWVLICTTSVQPVELPYCFLFFIEKNNNKKVKNWWWIGAWRHGLMGFWLLVCLFLFQYPGRRVVLSADVLWRFISQQSTCKRNMWNVVNKYKSNNKVDFFNFFLYVCPEMYRYFAQPSLVLTLQTFLCTLLSF